MPGKHAPDSPASFYLSVARAAGGALVVLGVVAVIAVAATGSGGKKPAAHSSTPPPTANATTSSTPSATATPTATPTTTPALSTITVSVLNGTQRPGLATTLSNKLKSDGYTVSKPGNQAAHQSLTTIYYRAGSRSAAEALLAAHPELKRVAPAPSTQTVTLTVVIGDDYKAA